MKIYIVTILGVAIASFHTAESYGQTSRDDTSEFARNAVAEYEKSSEYDCLKDYPCFEVHLDYPDEYNTTYSLPWKDIDFKTDPERYMMAVVGYAGEGNISVDWNLEKNRVRKWYHAPWMHLDKNGREPIRGLTRERGSRWHELSSKQTRRVANWAVGFYNDRGGYTFGQVWKNKTNPDTSNVQFPVGTVSVKLLFSDATDEEAPYLVGRGKGLTWHAQIVRGAQPKALRLLQVDIAVRDENADETTGWVFGTFMFDSSMASSNYWENLVPVGLQWGNDPELTRKKYDAGERPLEGWINPVVAKLFASHRPPFGDLGYLGRVNGPVDNPLSSCLACHGRAVDTLGQQRVPHFTAEPSDMCVEDEKKDGNEVLRKVEKCDVDDAKEARIRIFFRNLKTGEPFCSNMNSLDYSLQMTEGIVRWAKWEQGYRSQSEARTRPPAPISSCESTERQSVEGLVEYQIPTLPVEKAFRRGDADL